MVTNLTSSFRGLTKFLRAGEWPGCLRWPGFPVSLHAIQPLNQLSLLKERWNDLSICFLNTLATTTTKGPVKYWIQVAGGDSQRSSNSISTLVSASTAPRSIIISALDIHSASTACLEDLLAIHTDLLAFGRVFAVAFAVGLDVFAISLAVGTAQLNRKASVRVGMAFASAEIVMQLAGYGLGTGANRIFGEVAVYVGFALLACIGVMMFANSFRHSSEAKFDATHGLGLLIASLSISLDSLGIGIALPALGIALLPLLVTVSITTTVFTLIGLSFGARLGERYERNAERAAGIILVALAVLFAFERTRSHF
jgi:putative Mn2+ efflux pump MntP